MNAPAWIVVPEEHVEIDQSDPHLKCERRIRSNDMFLEK